MGTLWLLAFVIGAALALTAALSALALRSKEDAKALLFAGIAALIAYLAITLLGLLDIVSFSSSSLSDSDLMSFGNLHTQVFDAFAWVGLLLIAASGLLLVLGRAKRSSTIGKSLDESKSKRNGLGLADPF